MSEFAALRKDIGKVFDEIKETRGEVANIDKRIAVFEVTTAKDVAELKRRMDEHDKFHLKQKEKLCNRIWDLLIRIVPPAILLAITALIAAGKAKLGWVKE